VEQVKVGRTTKRIPIYVTITIRATETDGATRIVGIGRGTADTSDFACGLVRRIAEKRAADELRTGLADALLRIQEGGERYYAGGASYVLSIVQSSIDIGNRR
jgi:hypothetical protein